MVKNLCLRYILLQALELSHVTSKDHGVYLTVGCVSSWSKGKMTPQIQNMDENIDTKTDIPNKHGRSKDSVFYKNRGEEWNQ